MQRLHTQFAAGAIFIRKNCSEYACFRRKPTCEKRLPVRSTLTGAQLPPPSPCWLLLHLQAPPPHVLDQDTVMQGSSPNARWREPNLESYPGEIALKGKRIKAASGLDEVVLAWNSKLRYASKRNGYHGGCAPGEALVPIATYRYGRQLCCRPPSLPRGPMDQNNSRCAASACGRNRPVSSGRRSRASPSRAQAFSKRWRSNAAQTPLPFMRVAKSAS